ncbi:tRNA pseudouridine(38-40) synthase [Sarracenia purpurea var. burkii]
MENPSLSPKEPEPKKFKMSTTTTDDDGDDDRETTVPGPERKQRYKRRKIAIFFAYCGVGYQGMQKNPGAKTIEGDLEEALFLSGAVPEQDRGLPKRFDWARSARTDKGVSAVGQVVSGRFYIDPPGLVDRLNSKLPPQIRIFGFKRVTASFNAKKFCDRRRYVYLLPVFALDPCSHRDRESVLASSGSENELAKCVECSERGRKVVGVMGKRSFEPKSDNSTVVQSETRVGTAISSAVNSNDTRFEITAGSGISSNNGNALLLPVDKEANLVSLERSDYEISNNTDNHMDSSAAENVGAVSASELAIEEKKIEDELIMSENGKEQSGNESRFCYGKNEREIFNRILKHYEGAHNFHNFTTRTKAEDPSAKRFIVSFDANTVVSIQGIEFVKCEVVGQSFMLHQIRKMVGLAVAIMRNCAPESLMETALQQNVSINVPTAPEVGLYLDECLFTSYNQKWKESHEEVSMKAYSQEAEDFKMNHIYSHIASTEHKDGVVALWLHSLNYRNYPDLRVVSDGGTSNAISAEADFMPE